MEERRRSQGTRSSRTRIVVGCLLVGAGLVVGHHRGASQLAVRDDSVVAQQPCPSARRSSTRIYLERVSRVGSPRLHASGLHAMARRAELRERIVRMAEVRLERVDFCEIDAHGNCFRALFTGTQVDPMREWHLQWDPTAGGVWRIVTPLRDVHVVRIPDKYADWPPIGLVDVDIPEIATGLRSVVTYIGDDLWPRGEPSPFPTQRN